AQWNDFSDSTYRIRMISPDRRLGLIDGTAVFTNNAAGADAVNWQLLLNHRDGSYRIRNVKSGLVLVLADISKNPGTRVVGEQYSALPHQDWFLDIVSTSPLRFRFINVYSGLALEPLNSNQALGTPLAVAAPSDSTLQRWDTAFQHQHPKKGIAATSNAERPVPWGSGETWMENSHALFGKNASWSYSWGRQRSTDFPFMEPEHIFNPMQWGSFNWNHSSNNGPIDILRNDLQSNPRPVFLLGFNEPEKVDQGNVSVAVAITRWSRLLAMNAPLLSPAPASAFNGWLADFKAQADARGYRYDAIGVHWYGSPLSGGNASADGLINHLQSNFNTFGRPIWLTEFSAVDWNRNSNWTHAENYEFLAQFMWRAESLPWLQRYSVFQFVQGPTDNPNQSAPDREDAPRSNTRNEDGTLTAFGELYASWDGVTAVLPDRAYHLHNRGQYRRLRNTGAVAPGNAIPEDSGIGTQFFLSPTATQGIFRLISTRDGRPLRFWEGSGGEVGFGLVGSIASSTEWRIVAEQHGRYFIEHVNTNRRLSNTSNGSFTMAPAGTNNNNTQWRFINPLDPDLAGPPARPSGIAAAPAPTEIVLTWNPVAGAVSYTIYRSTAPDGEWSAVADDVAATAWTDQDLAAETDYFYQIRATNTYALSSPVSSTLAATTLHRFASFASWAATKLEDYPLEMQAPEADPDGDGIPNLLEYAFLTDPSSPGGSPFRLVGPGANYMVIKFPWNRRATELNWQLRYSSDLSAPGTWPVVDPGTITITPDGDVDWIRVTPIMTDPQRGFYILEVLGL
ncbi:MAG: hypothetical protein EA353_14710, partial [Puniceicoccaceae bacterium]